MDQALVVAGPALAPLVVLCSTSLATPVPTIGSPEGSCTRSQLAFAGVVSVALWSASALALALALALVQTVRHRAYFFPAADAADDMFSAAGTCESATLR